MNHRYIKNSKKGVDKDIFAYRIFNFIENVFLSSGNSLYSNNSRTVWMSKGGASNTLKQLPIEIQEKCEIKKYKLVEEVED